MARAGLFVDEYQQARRDGGGEALALVRVDRPASDALLAELRALPDVTLVQQVDLR